MKLSVFVVTYNQERYIRQCLDGIFAQKANFDYEIIIGDDCSTDGTAAILDEYAAKYPHVQVYHHPKNLGLLKNWEFVMNKCQGEYIAIVEGDDYWIDENKLQTQVDYLDAHPDCAFTFTSANIQIEPGGQKGEEQSLKNIREGKYVADDYVGKPLCILSSTVVCRNVLQPIHYDKRLLYADFYTFMRLFEKGYGYGFNKQMATYRVHAANLSRQSEQFCRGKFRQDRFLKKIFPKYADYFEEDAEVCLQHLIYFHEDGWKYRFIKMKQQPKLFFSRFFLTTIGKYFLKGALLRWVHYYEIKRAIKRFFFLRRIEREDDQLRKRIAQQIRELPMDILHANHDASDIIVSMTSYGRRLSESCPYALYSMFTQTLRPNRICLFLDDSWSDETLPPLIKRLQQSGLEVYYGEDLRSYKKLIPALRQFPDNRIVTVDDDFYYNKNLCQWLVEEYERAAAQDEQAVVGSWASVETSYNGEFVPYNSWPDGYGTHENEHWSLKAGNGTLYPPHVFDDEICKSDVFMKLAPTADDLWFWAMERRQNIPIRQIRTGRYGLHRSVNRLYLYDLHNQEDALSYKNDLHNENEQQFRVLIRHYGITPHVI